MALYGLGVSRKQFWKTERENRKINRKIDRSNLRTHDPKIRQFVKPRHRFTIFGIDGANVYYGKDRLCDFLNFGSPVYRTGSLRELTVVQTEGGDVFMVMPTGHREMPWVFDQVQWH